MSKVVYDTAKSWFLNKAVNSDDENLKDLIEQLLTVSKLIYSEEYEEYMKYAWDASAAQTQTGTIRVDGNKIEGEGEWTAEFMWGDE